MHTYSVQLRISGTHLEPNEITNAVGLVPTLVRVAGQRRTEHSVWDESVWSYAGTINDKQLDPEWQSLEEGLDHLLDVLESRRELLEPYFRRFDVIWWCGHFQSSFDGGPTLSARLLSRLATFGVSLYIDNYFSADSSPSEEG